MAKEKFYTKWGVAIDKDGQKHYVTVVGRRVQEKISVPYADEVEVELSNGKKANGVVLYEHPKTQRTFSMARAICDPRDEFDENVGFELAVSRLDKNPIGTQSSTYVTMLNDDQCEALVSVEVEHICKRIDTYIQKKGKKA